jgi:predicted NBD/HSP70 family sugar kinase
VVHAVRRHGITTSELLREELHYDDIDRHIKPLVAAGILERMPPMGGGKADHGQRPVQLHPTSGVLVGVDITNDRAQVAVTDAAYNLLNASSYRCRTEPLHMDDPDMALAEVADIVAVALQGTGHDDGRYLVGVGLSLPGPIRRMDDLTRVSASRSVLPAWRGVPVARKLRALLFEREIVPPRGQDRPIVAVENDASAGALGVFTQALRAYYDERIADGHSIPSPRMNEHWLTLRNSRIDDLVYVRVTKGIGAGVVSKGHLVEGGRGFAGELAHVRVNPAGPICPSCGGLGCLETWCSERAFTERLSTAGEEEVQDALSRGHGIGGQTEKLLDSESRGRMPSPATHPAVQQAVWDAGWHLGLALSHVCALLNPKLIVLGGAMTETEAFKRSVLNAIERNTIPQLSSDLVVINWRDIHTDDEQVPYTPELLGALAKVHDECGDGYYLEAVQRWPDEGGTKNPKATRVTFDPARDAPTRGRLTPRFAARSQGSLG